jgi:general secretion pathway protein G
MNYTKKAIVKPARSRRGVRKQSGFTLIEILVVMAIIAMLAVMVAPNIFNQQAGAQRDAAISQISSLQAALDMYRLDIGGYPDGLEGLVENDTGRASWNGPYLRGTVPADPWGNNYVYTPGAAAFGIKSDFYQFLYFGLTVSAIPKPQFSALTLPATDAARLPINDVLFFV